MAVNINNGDFQTLYKNAEKKLYRSALYLTKNQDDANDLLQDSCVRAYLNFDKFEQNTNFTGWMIKIINRLFLNKINRRKENYHKVDCDELHNHIPYIQKFDIENYGDEMIDAFRKLPRGYIELMEMAYVDEYSYIDIAKITNIKINTVKTRIHRSKKIMGTSVKLRRLR